MTPTGPTGPSSSPLDREFSKLFGTTVPKQVGPPAPTGPVSKDAYITARRALPPGTIKITEELLRPTDVVERRVRQKTQPILAKEMEKIFGKDVTKVLGPRLFEQAQLLAESRERAIVSGVPSDKVERLLTGQGELIPGPGGYMAEKSGGIEDFFYGILGSGPAQKFFTIPVVEKGLKGVDVYSQYTQRSAASGIKEAVDLIPAFPGRKFIFGPKGEASWEEFINQPKDPKYGWGTAFPLNSKQYIDLTGVPGLGAANKWIDRAAGFAGDVIISPETWISGVGGIIKQGILKLGARGLIGELGEETVRKAVTTSTGELSEAALDVVIKNAGKKGGEFANVSRVEALAFAKREALLAREAADIAKDAAEINRLNGRINSINKQLAVIAPPKSFGTASNMSNAKDLITIRTQAQQTIETGTYAARAATPAEIALAQRVVNTITPELIQQVGTKGIGVLAKSANKEASQLLGATFGLKVGVPLTSKQVVIPGSKYLTTAIGGGLRGVRGLVRTTAGSKILQRLVPMGIEGILKTDDILKIRTAFASGKYTDEFGNTVNLTAEQAQDFLNVIALHDGYLTGYNYIAKFRAQQGRQLLREIDKSTWEKIGPMLMNPETRWGVLGLSRKNLNADELAAFQKVGAFLKQLDIADETVARQVGAEVYPRFAAALAPTQSKDFLIWAQKNPKGLAKIAEGLGLDPTTVLYSNFVGRLKPGMVWFGKVLTQDDINAGLPRLNEIARNPKVLGQQTLKFDVFSTEVRESLIRAIDRHARYQAYVKTMQDFVEESGDLAYERAMEMLPGRQLPNEIGARIELLKQKVNSFMTPETITQWSKGELEWVLAALEDISFRMGANSIDARAINSAVQQIDSYVSDIAANVDQGILPPISNVIAGTEATQAAMDAAAQVAKVKQVYWDSDPTKWQVMVPQMLRDGFAVIDDAMPTLTARTRNDVQQMLNNMLKASTDKTLWAGFKEAFDKTFVFIKTYLTSTPGFHARNAQTIVAGQMIAGALPKNATEAIGILTKWQVAKRKGTTLEQFINDLSDDLMRGVASGQPDFTRAIAKDAVAENLRGAFGVTGGGEVGSLKAGFIAGERPGILGLPARGVGPRGSTLQRVTQRASEVAANVPFLSLGQILPPAVSRRLGTSVEDVGRFVLTWDGLKQGLSLDRAIDRTNRFLFNYADLSALDKVGRQTFPFYTFMARNMMLQLTSVWTNPRFYAYYNTWRKNYEDTENESEFFPRDWRNRGVFKMVGDNPFYIKADLGIPQTTPTPLTQEFATTFASSNPIVRSIVEAYVFGESAYTGQPIARAELDREGIQKAAYVMRSIISPASSSARQLRLLTTLLPNDSFVDSAWRSDWATILFGTKEISEEDRGFLNQFAALSSYLGIPLTVLNDDMKLRELWNAYYEVNNATETKEKITRKQQEELEKERLGLP